jgi:hypothetical protein
MMVLSLMVPALVLELQSLTNQISQAMERFSQSQKKVALVALHELAPPADGEVPLGPLDQTVLQEP